MIWPFRVREEPVFLTPMYADAARVFSVAVPLVERRSICPVMELVPAMLRKAPLWRLPLNCGLRKPRSATKIWFGSVGGSGWSAE